MSRISKGTVSVASGMTAVSAWDSDNDVVLSAITAPAGSPVVIEGYANFVAERVSTTEFTLELPHAGAGGAGLACAISAVTANETSIATLNQRTAQVIQDLSVLDANGRGLFYNLIGVTGDNDPGPGNAAFDEGDPAAVTEIYLDVLDANAEGRDVSGLIGLWSAGTVITLRSIATNAYLSYRLTAAPSGAGGYRKVAVEYRAGDGSLANEPVAIEWNRAGRDLAIDAAGLFADRDDYDAAAAGFVYAAVDGAEGEGAPTVLYIKNSATSGDWSSPVEFQGPVGPAPNLTAGTVTTGAAGSDASVVVGGSNPNYTVGFTIPRGDQGYQGWAMEPELVPDGASRTVIRVADWVGGEGTKPGSIGEYIGSDGLTSDIAEAVNVQGNSGPTGPIGIVWAGAWNDATEYTPNMIVTDPDAAEAPAIWIALTTNTDSRPRDNATDWAFFPGTFAIPADYGFIGETPETFTDYGSIA